ncbi:MAG TPA: PaaX domain-containing protein, C- domain protein [Nocardioidaceae bacterium]|nr:PaaX domain-containing protein, C- domain protein [Nocardioidaceae bacterium]
MSQPPIRPISTRSALLTLLIGGPLDVDGLEGAQLVRFGEGLGISESTVRVALSRMLTSGDLVREGSTYLLSDRLRTRRDRQRAVLQPTVKRWRGDWELVVVTQTGRSAADRAALREQLSTLRLAELREGVWMRPDNLSRSWDDEAVERLVVRAPDDPARLVEALWDLTGWVARGDEILAAVDNAPNYGARFAACVAGVRHLMTDPALPAELRPREWPAAPIRAAYDESLSWMTSLM